MDKPLYPSLYQINTRVWLTELFRKLERQVGLDDIPDADLDRLADFGTSCSSARIRGKISPACPNRAISERAGSMGTALELPCDSPSRPPGSHERSLAENETCSAGHRTILGRPADR